MKIDSSAKTGRPTNRWKTAIDTPHENQQSTQPLAASNPTANEERSDE